MRIHQIGTAERDPVRLFHRTLQFATAVGTLWILAHPGVRVHETSSVLFGLLVFCSMGWAIHSARNQVSQEQSRGTLELLMSTPFVPDGFIASHVFGWMSRGHRWWNLNLFSCGFYLWMSWRTESVLHGLAQLAPLIVVSLASAALIGVRLALATRGRAWSVPIGLVLAGVLTCYPLSVGMLTAQTSPSHRLQELAIYYAAVLLGMLALRLQWGSLSRFLEGYSGVVPSSRNLRHSWLARLLDRPLLRLAALTGLTRNPFFMRERTRALHRVSQGPAVLLPSLMAAGLVWFIAHRDPQTVPATLAFWAIPLLFAYWIAGAAATQGCLLQEFEGRTLDAMRIAAIDAGELVVGLMFGRQYVMLMGWLASLPLWLAYACYPEVSLVTLTVFCLVLPAVAIVSGLGGLRAACTSLRFLRVDRAPDFSAGLSNPGLWFWIAPGLFLSFFCLRPVCEPLGLLSAWAWIPLDLITLFPTWFYNPTLLPLPLWFLGPVVHGAVLYGTASLDVRITTAEAERALVDNPRQAVTFQQEMAAS